MAEEFLVEARRQAERAVADMEEGPLKLKAFEVILGRLLQGTDPNKGSVSIIAATSGKLDRVEAGSSGRPTTERTLIQEKKPVNHSETVAVLAFFLRGAGAAEFTEEDMRTAYVRAGVRLPKVMTQAIRDAKNKFDFIKPGQNAGSYVLTDHGDRTVRFDLPRS